MQQQQQKPTTVTTAVSPPSAPAAAANDDNNVITKKKKKKLTFADQAALPIMIPKSVAREPAGTALLIELPPGVELTGASGVVGRIIGNSSGSGGGGSESDDISLDSESGGEEQPQRGGLVLDLMGKLQLYTSLINQLKTILSLSIACSCCAYILFYPMFLLLFVLINVLFYILQVFSMLLKSFNSPTASQ
jgi:hypothetical protein